MTNQITAETLTPIIHKSLSVVTTDLLAKLYGTDNENIKKNYGRNLDRFVEGKHYFKLEGSDLRDFKHKVTNCPFVKIAKNVRHLMLWTERGAARHAKMLETDQAWEVFEQLEDFYFSQKANAESQTKKTTVDERTPLRDAVNMLVSKKHLMYPEAYAMIHQRFNVDSIEALDAEQIPLAIEYVHRVALEGEFLGKQEELPAPKLEINFPLSWFAEHAPRTVARQQSGDLMLLDRDTLVEYSPCIKLFSILEDAGYEIGAVKAEVLALRKVMEDQHWALKEITSYAAVRNNARLCIKM